MLVESRRRAVMTEYEQALRASGSRLVHDPDTLAQCLRQACQIFSDVAESLRRSDIVFTEEEGLTADIAAHRASRNVHPDESFDAAQTLSRIITSVVTDALDGHPDALRLSGHAARALNHSLISRIRMASSGYAGFLLHKIHEAHVDERRRIARELHDRIGHGVGVASRNLELYDLLERRRSPQSRDKIAAARHALDDTLDSLRDLISGLRLVTPLTSLEDALRHYIGTVDTGMTDAAVLVNGDETWIGDDGRDELFLIVREALRNAFAHAGATAVAARIDFAPHEVRALIRDDGIGFHPPGVGASGGSGLTAMQERATLLGGHLHVSSQPGRGTVVEVFIPLPGAGHATRA